MSDKENNAALQDDTPCTLQLKLNGELTDVARGNINCLPQNRTLHNVAMADVMMVCLVHTLPGYEGLDPPIQPADAEGDYMVLGCLKSWQLEWPKTLIRLENSPGTTPAPSGLGQSRPVPEEGPPSQEYREDNASYVDDAARC
jgi:hypothetical protein